ncbi:MAG: hypothetical protein MRZ29_03815 [Oscillospiraceae bacterium]|nr:hypothetical protein [Oscillospiraceae bacterium]
MRTFKKLLCAVFAASLVASPCTNFVFAEGEYVQQVELKSFMPPVGKIIVDDNFEGNSEYPIAVALNSSNSVEEENGNKAVKLNSWNSIALVASDNYIDSDKIVVSFDAKATGTSFAEAVNGDKFDLTKRSALHFGIRAGGKGEDGTLFASSGATKPDLIKETLSGWQAAGKSPNSKTSEIAFVQNNDENNGYVNITMMFERRENGVYMTALYINEKNEITANLKLGFAQSANWWSNDGAAKVLLQNRTGKTLYNYYDNILVYVPAPFDTNSFEIDDDGKGAKIIFNSDVDKSELPEFTLTDEKGTYECTADKGADAKEIHVTFPVSVDIENKSYYLEFNKASSAFGQKTENVRLLLGKEYAGEISASASKDASGISVDIAVPAKADGDVNAVVTAFSGDSIVDFKVEKITLDTSSGENYFNVTLNGEEALQADKIQVFLIDGTENMHIISNVETPSF